MATSSAPDQHDHFGGPKWEMGFAIASGVTYLSGVVFEYFVPGAPVNQVAIPLFLATYFFGGFFTFTTAIRSVRRGRFEVDFLMLVAAIGAATVGKFAEGAVLLFLFSLGHALEEYAMGRAKKSIEALAELAPATALVREGDQVVERPTEQLEVGDVVVVRPHARIPADGFVSVGNSAVDQSAITGESIPVEKGPVDSASAALARPNSVPESSRVFAGTVNGNGALDVTVLTPAKDSTLARVVQMVRDADATKSPTQLFIDRFQRYYVPAVIALVAVVFAVGWLWINEPLSESFYRSMLILVAASPCALAIATPAAVLSGVARAARAGLLVKGGAPLETLGKVTSIAFDKTGTLTWGMPRLTDVKPATGADEATLGAVALALESSSDHPLAVAIVRDLEPKVPAESRLKASGLEAVTGKGIIAAIGGKRAQIGSLEMFVADAADGSGPAVPEDVVAAADGLQSEGRTIMVVSWGQQFLGVLGVMDTPRAEAASVLNSLRQSGVQELVMISGDNQKVADAVGGQVGVDTARGGLMPEDKVTTIKSLSAKGQTAMVGDGVNDAPAMANASVGVAMGAASSAVALDTADVALMSDDIGRVPFLIRLSRATTKIIRQNLIVSLAIVAFLVPASLLGMEMGPVVFIHEGSTFLVVLNALRLLRFDVGREHDGIEHEERP
ncbi:heavy metal translocating P-type ATPase [Haematomicrobium sanguinis]|uniref:heavy metal translocating P-type ATPase n=1 Tax=Haematomicrobium sanguinis TaxID=479106 RepID=UPI00054ECD4D|nr:heavy metal translocating P-type ATPase [Haematomicrobium sanguinis]